MEDDDLTYIFHLTRDTFKLDEDDTEHYYCKYCKKKMKLRSFNRHNNSEDHQMKQRFFKQNNITDQIYIRLVDDFEAGKYDPNDVNLVGKEKLNRFKQLERETWEKYVKAKMHGYFNQYFEDDDINFEDYDFFYEKVIQSGQYEGEDYMTMMNGTIFKIPKNVIQDECDYIRWSKIIEETRRKI